MELSYRKPGGKTKRVKELRDEVMLAASWEIMGGMGNAFAQKIDKKSPTCIEVGDSVPWLFSLFSSKNPLILDLGAGSMWRKKSPAQRTDLSELYAVQVLNREEFYRHVNGRAKFTDTATHGIAEQRRFVHEVNFVFADSERMNLWTTSSQAQANVPGFAKELASFLKIGTWTGVIKNEKQ